LKLLKLPKNSEVLVASNSYVACILSILNAGLKPVLIEPNLETYNIDPNQIKKKITKKTRAVLAVHLYGKSCEMDEIIKICKKKEKGNKKKLIIPFFWFQNFGLKIFILF
jgi:dTDP-4-amino-4,6-dideoxygalactose transaminase